MEFTERGRAPQAGVTYGNEQGRAEEAQNGALRNVGLGKDVVSATEGSAE